MIYGYTRISKPTQSIDRQIRNIKKEYPDAVILKEAYTGTKMNRPEWSKLIRTLKPGDTVVFDSVSRMSRNAEEGTSTYFSLLEKDINLVFLKEGYINTETYKSAVEQSIGMTGNEIADVYIEATNKVIRLLAAKQIEKAFEQSEKEVMDLHQRTKEGIETARLNGKQIGTKPGTRFKVKKKEPSKTQILKYSKRFNGSLNDRDCMKLINLSPNTFYKYKKELTAEREQNVRL